MSDEPCTKHTYPSHKLAHAAIRALRWKNRELRAYKCQRCDQWHLTTQWSTHV